MSRELYHFSRTNQDDVRRTHCDNIQPDFVSVTIYLSPSSTISEPVQLPQLGCTLYNNCSESTILFLYSQILPNFEEDVSRTICEI